MIWSLHYPSVPVHSLSSPSPSSPPLNPLSFWRDILKHSSAHWNHAKFWEDELIKKSAGPLDKLDKYIEFPPKRLTNSDL